MRDAYSKFTYNVKCTLPSGIVTTHHFGDLESAEKWVADAVRTDPGQFAGAKFEFEGVWTLLSTGREILFDPYEEGDDEPYDEDRGSYGPATPWNAPGMRISDFI